MRILSLLVIVLSVASCRHEKNKTSPAGKTELDSLSFALTQTIEQFSLFSRKGVPDSSELYFYCEKPFDTSYLVHFRKEKDLVQGVLYQVVQPYHAGYLAAQRDSLLYFEGYRFLIDSVQWKHITKEAMRILVQKDERGRKEGCFDCSTYMLAFDSKVRYSYSSDEVLLPAFANFLKGYLLDARVAKRKSRSM